MGDSLTGFVNYEGASVADGTFNGVLEEGFAHLQLASWLAVGGGQFLNSFGFQNERHVHAWEFVDQYLVSGRMLNEGELTTQGGEVILELPTPWKSALTLGGGRARVHAEDHGEHGHGHKEAEFEADGANFDDWLFSVNYRADYGHDEAMASTVSLAIGENGFGGTTRVYGIGHEIIWNRPQVVAEGKGEVIDSHPEHEFGAGSLRWRTEMMFRAIETISGGDEHAPEGEEEKDVGNHHDVEQDDRDADLAGFGVYSMLQYGVCDWANAAFRAEWVSGIDEMALDERWRFSPAITAYLNHDRTVHARLQYNSDRGGGFHSEHSIWFQVGIAWGGAPGSHGHEH